MGKEELIKDTFKGYTVTKQDYKEYYVNNKNATIGSYQQYSYESIPYILFIWGNCKLWRPKIMNDDISTGTSGKCFNR